MKLLPNHIMVWYKFYYKLISDIIVNDCTTKKILKSQYTIKTLFYIIFNWSVYPIISSTKSGPQPELDIPLHLFPDGPCGFYEAVCELVESEKDNKMPLKMVGTKLSRNYGLSKHS